LLAPEAGNYLLRVETINPNQDAKHPDFAAIDLKVE
jgi:hypothetical protein